jgi:adenylosuccinate synthase
MSSVRVIVGAQWGDEGKGKMVDYFAETADMVVRFQGGDNAGHTVINEYGTFKTHLIPSGVFKKGCICLCNTGMVINPDELLKELEMISGAGVDVNNVLISSKATILMPYHITFDNIKESGTGSIGSTKRGIAYAYQDRARRLALRFEDLLDLEYAYDRLSIILDTINRELVAQGAAECDIDELKAKISKWAEVLSMRIVEPVSFVNKAIDQGKNIIFEGQLGAMKDLDLGTYPYVTSSNPVAAYAAVGGGFPHHKITDITGIMKAFSSAVGKGPFPTEMPDDEAERFRGTGEKADDEYGARTGRARRLGWPDLVAVKYAATINGFTDIALMKIDKLDNFNELKVCVAYKLDGKVIDYMPSTRELERVECVYKTIPGWLCDTTKIRKISELPENALNYIRLIEDTVKVPVKYVGVGPEREQLAR